MIHPKPDDQGQPVVIHHPSKPSIQQAWMASDRIAIVTPGGAMPDRLNGIALSTQDNPSDNRARATDFEEPPFDPGGLEPAAGAVIVEPDGRVWLIAPTNAYAGYQATFPKGRLHGNDLRKTAIREVFEETGLQIELFGHLIDITRSTTHTRYYLARRIGGNPSDMGWESQAVILCPAERLKEVLNKSVDQKIVDALWHEWGSRALWFQHPPKRSSPEQNA